MGMKVIEILDTTLRDGSQGAEIIAQRQAVLCNISSTARAQIIANVTIKVSLL